MTFEEHRNKLRAKKYDAIPAKELNQLVLEGKGLDRVANSLQRMVVQIISKRFSYKHAGDDLLLEYVAVGNSAIAEAIVEYKHEKVDFGLFVYHKIFQHFNHYYRHTQNTVKSAKVNGERIYASYFELDKPIDDDGEDFSQIMYIDTTDDEKVSEIDFKLILELIRKRHKLFKQKYIDVYRMSFDGYNQYEIAAKYDMTPQRVSQICKNVEDKIKENKKILAYLSQF